MVKLLFYRADKQSGAYQAVDVPWGIRLRWAASCARVWADWLNSRRCPDNLEVSCQHLLLTTILG